MSIVIHTSYETFIVPQEKESALVSWLQQNAVLAGKDTVKEQTNGSNFYPGRQLINETYKGE